MAGSPARSVFMPVVNIRVMGVGVFLAIMPVWMRMRFAPRIVRLMLMAVVLVVHVEVFVFYYLMHMPVLMALREVQPQTARH